MTTLYAKAVCAVEAVATSGEDPASIRVDLEALKALIDVMIAKLPEEGGMCDACLIGGARRCYHNQQGDDNANT